MEGSDLPPGAIGHTRPEALPSVFVSVQLEEQLSRLQREKNEIQNRLEEDQEDMNELMKKHKAAVAQVPAQECPPHPVPHTLSSGPPQRSPAQPLLWEGCNACGPWHSGLGGMGWIGGL